MRYDQRLVWGAMLLVALLLAMGCNGGGGGSGDNDQWDQADNTDLSNDQVDDTPAEEDFITDEPDDIYTDPDPIEQTDDLDLTDPADQIDQPVDQPIDESDVVDWPDYPDIPDTVDTMDVPDVVETVDQNDYERDPDVEARCAALVAGLNSNFMVDNEARSFILALPNNVENGGPWPVIFNWHGYGDTAQNMSGLISPYVNNSFMPFIAVTPEDTNIPLPTGVDWAILNAQGVNKEARLFDEVLYCLDQKYGVDWNHIHSIGFSAGAIATDMMGVLRGDVVASLISLSGGYFSNPQDANMFTNWPAMTTTNRYTQVIAYGGNTDTWSAVILTIPFYQFAANDTEYLNGMGHDVILCNHNSGHSVPSGMQGQFLIKFFADHPKGTVDSPYAAGLPSGWPNYCTFQPHH